MFQSTKRIVTILIFAGTLHAQQHGSIAERPFSTPVDLEAGTKSFRSQCAACHGLRGDGGAQGADLSTGAFKNGSSDEALFRVISKGVSGTSMVGFPLNGREIWQLITFIRSLSVGKANETAKGNAAKGRTIFAANGCARCHAVGTEGGLTAPDLTEAGSRLSLDQIASAVIDPNAQVDPEYWSVRAKTKAGRTISGLRLNEDMDSIQWRDASGKLSTVMKADLASFEIVRASPMPSFKGKLQGADLDDLVAYLASLRRPVEAEGKSK